MPPRKSGAIYNTGHSIEDLCHRQSGGLYGTGSSLDVLPGNSGEDVDSQPESDEAESDFSDKIEGDDLDALYNFGWLDVWCEINKWCGNKTREEKSKAAFEAILIFSFVSRSLHHDNIYHWIMKTVQQFQVTYSMAFVEALVHAVSMRWFFIHDTLAISAKEAERA